MKKIEQQPKLSAALRANLKRRKGQKQATQASKPTSIRTGSPATDRRDSA